MSWRRWSTAICHRLVTPCSPAGYVELLSRIDNKPMARQAKSVSAATPQHDEWRAVLSRPELRAMWDRVRARLREESLQPRREILDAALEQYVAALEESTLSPAQRAGF